MATPISINTTTVAATIAGRSLGGMAGAELDIGFSAPYAVYVHENLQAAHLVGQAKYLESAYRSPAVQQQMRDALRQALKSKRSVADALVDAGNVLLKAAQALVPVDTGLLRDSGYVDVLRRTP